MATFGSTPVVGDVAGLAAGAWIVRSGTIDATSGRPASARIRPGRAVREMALTIQSGVTRSASPRDLATSIVARSPPWVRAARSLNDRTTAAPARSPGPGRTARASTWSRRTTTTPITPSAGSRSSAAARSAAIVATDDGVGGRAATFHAVARLPDRRATNRIATPTGDAERRRRPDRTAAPSRAADRGADPSTAPRGDRAVDGAGAPSSRRREGRVAWISSGRSRRRAGRRRSRRTPGCRSGSPRRSWDTGGSTTPRRGW